MLLFAVSVLPQGRLVCFLQLPVGGQLWVPVVAAVVGKRGQFHFGVYGLLPPHVFACIYCWYSHENKGWVVPSHLWNVINVFVLGGCVCVHLGEMRGGRRVACHSYTFRVQLPKENYLL